MAATQFCFTQSYLIYMAQFSFCYFTSKISIYYFCSVFSRERLLKMEKRAISPKYAFVVHIFSFKFYKLHLQYNSHCEIKTTPLKILVFSSNLILSKIVSLFSIEKFTQDVYSPKCSKIHDLCKHMIKIFMMIEIYKIIED